MYYRFELLNPPPLILKYEYLLHPAPEPSAALSTMSLSRVAASSMMQSVRGCLGCVWTSVGSSLKYAYEELVHWGNVWFLVELVNIARGIVWPVYIVNYLSPIERNFIYELAISLSTFQRSTAYVH